MYEQLNMFSAMEAQGQEAAFQFILDRIRKHYWQYTEDRTKALKDGEQVAKYMTIEEFAEDLCKRWHGESGFDGPYWGLQLSPNGAEIHERHRTEPYKFTKYRLLREM